MPPLHDLYKELQGHNDFFDLLVDMIPAKVYVAGQSGDSAYNSKYFKGQHKESKESRRARNKAAKKAKFDPATTETTHQLKLRLEQEEANMDDDDDDDSDDEAENQAPETKKGKKKNKKTPPGKTAQVAPDTTTTTTTTTDSTPTNVSRIDALREKLHAKLAEKRGQRPLDPTTISKRASRRAEKLKRKEDALKKSASTKVKDAKKAFVLTSPNAAAVAPKEDLKSLDFGKLAGLNKTPESFQNNKSLKNLNKKKNLELMLQKAEEKRDRLEQLKQGTEEDKKKAANMMWGEALKEASGDRIKDDPAKLKKALKRKVTQKEKSQKAWKSRMDQTKEKMEERLAIRTHNLNKRKEGGAAGANLSSKKIKDDAKDGEEKKSRKMSRAGFEGKKQEFLNNKKKNGSTTPINTTQ